MVFPVPPLRFVIAKTLPILVLLCGAKILALMIHSHFCGLISAPFLFGIIMEKDYTQPLQPLSLLGYLDLVLLYRMGIFCA